MRSIGGEHTAVEPGERALALRCADGDSQAWSELVARHERRILLVLVRAGVRPDELADLKQEIYARLLAQKGSVLRSVRAERPGALGAFLAQMALRAAIDHGRSRGARARSEVEEEAAHGLASSASGPDDAALLQQGRARFARALLAAADGPNLARDLMVLRAHFADGMNPAEIAAMGSGLSAKGVETLLRRARLRIEAELGEGETGARSSQQEEER